jgi:hypothetical protein
MELPRNSFKRALLAGPLARAADSLAAEFQSS